MEVYVDEMLVKSLQANEPVSHLEQTFQILRKYKMKLNPLKCTFGVASGQFLGYIVNQRGIEANSIKIGALLEMRLPQKPKEVRSLNGRIAALSRFISRATDKSLPFFKVLKQGKNAVVVREEDDHQLPVYYVSKALLLVETLYPDMGKLALALITASRKLRPYFQAHSIEVLTNFPLKQVLQRTEASGHLLKWAIELSEFDLLFQSKHAIKGQALANFVVEFVVAPEVETTMEPAEPPTWNLFVDGSSRETSFGAGIVLENPEGHKLNCTIRGLLASNDSQLVMSQVNGNFATKDSSMTAYLRLVLDLFPHFERFRLIYVPRIENTHANALSKLVSNKNSELLKIVPIKHLSKPSISKVEELLWIESTPVWMQPSMVYLKDQSLSASRSNARKLRRRAANFILHEDVLYKRGFASPLFRCVEGK
ncbi:uncharacterized protein LOC111371181 [Olea europaea var. sylvestris]|uniref:uncharacterized protein LOC111371181 n=1 Tax=Olea europaea var. sylvestris TaxID=158386 RepID=UPI000C1D7DAC|nr:uncharacterized protein LOC111371181 [Olea europaea var. sylvestris]